MTSVRLQKFLSHCGIASRRKAEKLILQGHVTVNGNIVSALGTRISPVEDLVKINGRKILPEKKRYILIYKPRGVLCTMKDEFGRNIISQLLHGITERVYHVGRLDKESEGLLLMTNDGDLANKLIHPSHHVPKTYLVTITGSISENDILDLEKGIVIDGKKTLPAKISINEKGRKSTIVKCVLYEGRKRQIRRMFSHKGLHINKLKRTHIGKLSIGKLTSGKFNIISYKTACKIFF